MTIHLSALPPRYWLRAIASLCKAQVISSVLPTALSHPTRYIDLRHQWHPRRYVSAQDESTQREEPTCNGIAISAATNADMPRKELLVATALDDRPTLASTMYARVLAYIHLPRKVKRAQQRAWVRHTLQRTRTRKASHISLRHARAAGRPRHTR